MERLSHNPKNKIFLLLISFFVTLYGTYHTYYYDEILLGKKQFGKDLFTEAAKSYPLITAYLLIGVLVFFIIFISRRYLSSFLSALTEKRFKLFFILALFFLSFSPTNSSSALFLIPIYLQGIFFISFVFLCTHLTSPEIDLSNIFNQSIFLSDKKIFLIILFLISFISTNIISYTVFNHIPHTEDSISYLFQGTILSEGKLYAHAPSLDEFFKFPHIISHDQKWYSQYGPGHPLLLGLGILIKMPWIINPLFNAATTLLIYFLAKEIYENEIIAQTASLLSLFSPFLLFMSSEYMSHSTCLFFITAFLYCFVRSNRSRYNFYPFLSGFLLGYAIMIRQSTGFLIVGAATVYIFCAVIKKEYSIKKVLWFYGGLTLPVLILLGYNTILNDNPFVFRYISKNTSLSLKSYGFGITKKFSYLSAFTHSVDRINILNVFLFEWPIPSLFFAFIALGGKRVKFEYLLLLIPVFMSLGYFSREYLEICFGPRYLYETSVVWILLSARGVKNFYLLLSDVTKKEKREGYIKNLSFFLASFLIIFSLGYKFPKLVSAYSGSYWRVDDTLHQMVTQQKITNAVIFIRDEIDDWSKPFIWGAGFQKNLPSLDNDIIYVKDLNRRNLKLFDLYKQKNFYLCYYDEFIRNIVLKKISRRYYW